MDSSAILFPAAMRGERPVRLLLPPLEKTPIAKSKYRDPLAPRTAAVRKRAPRERAEVLGDRDQALFEALRSYRLKRASAQGVPPYVVASDRSLREIVAERPRSLDELLLVHGIGPAKAKRYGKGLLKVVLENPN